MQPARANVTKALGIVRSSQPIYCLVSAGIDPRDDVAMSNLTGTHVVDYAWLLARRRADKGAVLALVDAAMGLSRT